MIGETFSQYRVLEKIGAGGMGVVYKALDLQLERPVALKFLPADLLPSEYDRDRFLREARSACALDHPNIGVIHGIDKTADGRLFIVMAYYDGETLASKIASGPLPLGQALEFLMQIAAGLAAAHARNIVHRDIKPSNIIVTKDGTIRIVDFGLARVVATPSATLTQTTSGTLPYMAPEQILGESVDQRSDIWALSVLLVQLITGSHPFARENASAMSFAILNQPPAATDALPAALQPIALRGLAKKPEYRYSAAEDLLTDLESFQTKISTGGLPAEPATVVNPNTSPVFKEILSHASEPRWTTVPSATPSLPAKRRARTYTIATLAAAALVFLSLLIPTVRRRAMALFSGKAAEKHIAVLPFDNIGRDPANEPVAEGLMDSLTSKLTNLDSAQQSLWVVPASVVRSRKITDPAVAERALGANLVVQGSIRRDGKDIQLTVNLIDAKDLRQLGSAVIEDRTGDLSSLQDEVVARLGRLMNINVSAEMLRATGGRASPAAYEAYLKALGYQQRYDKPGNLDLAVAELESAVKTDPRFALGYAALAETYRIRYGLDPNPKWIDEAMANGSRAEQLDDRLPAVYVTLGRIHSMTGKPDLALQEYQKALAINPRDADAITGMGGAYERMGRIADAEATFQKAAALRPDFWDGYNTLGNFYARQRKNQQAIAQFRHVLELTPDNAAAYTNLGRAYLNTGDRKLVPEAEQAFKKSIELNPGYAAYANLGTLYDQQKRYADSAAATEKALAFNGNDYRVWSNLIAAYEWLKDDAKATAARERELPLVENLVKAQPQDAIAQSELASLYAGLKRREKALLRIETALAIAPDDGRVLQNVADAYETLSDRRNALRCIEKALQKGVPLDSLQSDPGLQLLLQEAKFRTQAK